MFQVFDNHTIGKAIDRVPPGAPAENSVAATMLLIKPECIGQDN